MAHLWAPAQSVGFPRLQRIGCWARRWLLHCTRPQAGWVLQSLPPHQLVGKQWFGSVVRIGRGNLDSH